ncbi:hypothetical protein [Paramicrobacterium chengjingii]|uniref:Uncharacterized protein n=1 Tax=Paramicrobacterium chengjingii TaxID=2769067 RepID=A0ABX6YLM1_9MICO|nr:hypothetical protein [Microbacterium chengjingii]QPZ39704.1 hypothetical protein HCR76_06570 [Microbacterium chengjingii]
MYKITHPRPQAGRQTEFGVNFTDGVAFVDDLHPERLWAFKQHRFDVATITRPRRKTVSKTKKQVK